MLEYIYWHLIYLRDDIRWIWLMLKMKLSMLSFYIQLYAMRTAFSIKFMPKRIKRRIYNYKHRH